YIVMMILVRGRISVDYISFSGVTIDNGNMIGSGCNGHTSTTSYLWDEAWNTFYDTLVLAGHPYTLAESATWPSQWP
ncbi:MAG: hypothetical protein ACUVWS_18210, partial [Roseiflexus sp.]